MPIQATRTMLRAALSGELDDAQFRTDDLFGFEVPLHVPGVDDSLLDPQSTWRDPEQYDVKARELAELFAENFTKRFGDVDQRIRAAGPRV
jgi:phosphoenolpyruvate carboxykinase (ATP)